MFLITSNLILSKSVNSINSIKSRLKSFLLKMLSHGHDGDDCSWINANSSIEVYVNMIKSEPQSSSQINLVLHHNFSERV